MEFPTNSNGSLGISKDQWPRIENCSKETINNWGTLPRNTSLIYEPLPYQSETAPLTITLIVIGVLGIIENCFILNVTNARRTFRGPITDKAGQKKALVYYFIFNLGCSDIMTAVASIIMVVQFYVNVFLETWSCRLIRFVGFLFTAITMEILLVISVERYFAVVRPYRTLNIDTSKMLVRGAWCVGFLLAVVATVTYDVKRACVTSGVYSMTCIPANTPVANALSLLFVLSVYIIPGVIVTFTTISTIFKLRCRAISVQPSAAEQLHKIRATKILLSVIIFFITPYMGLVIYSMTIKYVKIQLGYKMSYFVGYTTAIICFANCIINPILFVCQMKSLQQELKGYFKCRAVRFSKSNKVEPSNSSKPGTTLVGLEQKQKNIKQDK